MTATYEGVIGIIEIKKAYFYNIKCGNVLYYTPTVDDRTITVDVPKFYIEKPEWKCHYARHPEM